MTTRALQRRYGRGWWPFKREEPPYIYVILYQDRTNQTRSAGLVKVKKGQDSTRIIDAALKRERAAFERQGLRADTLRVVPVDD